MVQRSNEFLASSEPILSPDSPFNFVNIQIQVSCSYDRDIPVADSSRILQLLNLAWKLDQGKSLQPQLGKIFEATKDTLEIINPQRLKYSIESQNRGRGGFGGRQPGGVNVELSWPELKRTAPTLVAGVFGSRGTTAIIWGDHQPTPGDWHKYLILVHPVMKDTVDAALAKLEPAAAEIPAEKLDKLPTYRTGFVTDHRVRSCALSRLDHLDVRWAFLPVSTPSDKYVQPAFLQQPASSVVFGFRRSKSFTASGRRSPLLWSLPP